MPGDASPPARSRSEMLLGLADALAMLGTRVRTRDSAARDFASLVARADGIASQAHQLNTSKWQFEENAKALSAELVAFAKNVAEAAARVKVEATGDAAVADALSMHARRIAFAASDTGLAEPGALRAELQPLEATLVSLKTQVEAENVVMRDSDALAARAAELADGALRLLDGGRGAGAAAMVIHQELRGFVGQAGSISRRMSGALAGLGNVADLMAQRTREISSRPAVRKPAEGMVWHAREPAA